MTFKLGTISYFILIICTFLWNQQTSLLTQKIAVENSYRDKVASAISRLVGIDNFIVIVNVEFSNVDGAPKKTVSTQPKQGSANGYTPIPGLPTVPSREKSIPGALLKGRSMGEKYYLIERVEVDVNLNKELATADIKQEIKSLIKKAIPETRECEDCIKIESLGFLPLEKSKEIQELRKEITELRSEQRRAQETDLKTELQDAENRLNALQSEKERTDEKIKSRDEELERRDSLAHAKLIEFEKSRNKQDSIRNVNTENELRQVRDNRMNSDSTLLSKTMAIVEKREGVLSGTGIMSSVIFILLIICLMIVTFLAARNKKSKPIYLKPKMTNSKRGASENNEEKAEITSSESTPSPLIHDNEATRSELRSLRQTAVSLSVGEKESASALIKDWLEDKPSKEENT
jgi:hypothetical protein